MGRTAGTLLKLSGSACAVPAADISSKMRSATMSTLSSCAGGKNLMMPRANDKRPQREGLYSH